MKNGSAYHATAPPMMLHTLRDHPFRLALVALGGVVVGTVGFFLFRAWQTIEDIPREAFDTALAAQRMGGLGDEARREALEDQFARLDALATLDLEAYEEERAALEDVQAQLTPRARPFSSPYAVSPALPDELFDAYLMVGADASGFLADTIILGLVPGDGSAPMLASIPRDLYLPSPCSTTYARINTALGGCKGVASGPELVALMLEGYTGIQIDHYGRVNFPGFVRVVDVLGGIDVCVEYPTRDPKSGLDLQPGCIRANGEQTLAWVRSRHTQQLIDGTWRTVAGSDFSRQVRQQEVIFQLVGRLTSFESLANFSAIMESAASAVALDSGWSIGDAAALAWGYRGMGPADVVRLTIPVGDLRTSGGAAVLIPAATFNSVLARVYPAAAR